MELQVEERVETGVEGSMSDPDPDSDEGLSLLPDLPAPPRPVTVKVGRLVFRVFRLIYLYPFVRLAMLVACAVIVSFNYPWDTPWAAAISAAAFLFATLLPLPRILTALVHAHQQRNLYRIDAALALIHLNSDTRKPPSPNRFLRLLRDVNSARESIHIITTSPVYLCANELRDYFMSRERDELIRTMTHICAISDDFVNALSTTKARVTFCLPIRQDHLVRSKSAERRALFGISSREGRVVIRTCNNALEKIRRARQRNQLDPLHVSYAPHFFTLRTILVDRQICHMQEFLPDQPGFACPLSRTTQRTHSDLFPLLSSVVASICEEVGSPLGPWPVDRKQEEC